MIEKVKIHKKGDTPPETIKFKKNNEGADAIIRRFTFKDEKHFVCYAPSVNVSGYGDNEKEAEEDFFYQLNVFFEDLFELKLPQKKKVLAELGWNPVKYHNKQLSHAYIDPNGIIQNLQLDPKTEIKEELVEI